MQILSRLRLNIQWGVLTASRSFAQALDTNVLSQFAPRIIGDLGPFMLATTEDTLLLVLETMSICIEIGGGNWLTPELANSVTSASLQVWTKTSKGMFLTLFLLPRYADSA
jgi:hypothetical protein